MLARRLIAESTVGDERDIDAPQAAHRVLDRGRVAVEIVDVQDGAVDGGRAAYHQVPGEIAQPFEIARQQVQPRAPCRKAPGGGLGDGRGRADDQYALHLAQPYSF